MCIRDRLYKSENQGISLHHHQDRIKPKRAKEEPKRKYSCFQDVYKRQATFQAACEHASGAIIGSKFVTLLEEEKDPEKAITRLKE